MSRLRTTFAAMALAVGMMCATACSGDTGDDEHTITAVFDNGAGLYAGNKVAILGIPVGKVTRIEPRGTAVAVTMTVDGDVTIPADVQAVTISTSVLTDRRIELTPAYTSGPALARHASIPLALSLIHI